MLDLLSVIWVSSFSYLCALYLKQFTITKTKHVFKCHIKFSYLLAILFWFICDWLDFHGDLVLWAWTEAYALDGGFVVDVLGFFFNCILFIAFKIIVTEKLAEYCPVIPVFYSNKCYVWSVLKMAQLILKILSPKIYLQPKLRHIIVFSIR